MGKAIYKLSGVLEITMKLKFSVGVNQKHSILAIQEKSLLIG